MTAAAPSVSTSPPPFVPAAPSGAYRSWSGYRVHYVHAGEQNREVHPDRPALLLIHGFGASTDHWLKNIADLKADFEVYAIDLIGFGRSSKPNKGYGSPLWRGQLSAFIDEVVGRSVVVAGNSIGGYASLDLGATLPDRVQGVVMLNGVGMFSEQKPIQEPNPFQKAIGDLVKTVVLSPLPSWVIFQFVRNKSYIRKTLEQVYVNKSEVTDELIEAVYLPATDPDASAAFAALFKGERGEPVDHLLADLSQPLLLIWGDKDPWMNTYERDALFAKHYDNVEQQHINAGHCPHDDAPEEVNQLIRRWVLQTVVGASSEGWVALG